MNFKMDLPSDYTYNLEHIMQRRSGAEEMLSKLDFKEEYLRPDQPPENYLRVPPMTPGVRAKVKEILLAYGSSEDEVNELLAESPKDAYDNAIKLVTHDYFFRNFFESNGEFSYGTVFKGDKKTFNPEDYSFDSTVGLNNFYTPQPFVERTVQVPDTDGLPDYLIDQHGQITKEYPIKFVPAPIESGTVGQDILAIQGRVNITPEGELKLYKADMIMVGYPSDNEPVSIFVRKPD